MAYLTNPRVKLFLNHVKSQCKKCNIKFTLSSGHKVNAGDGERCLGYFQPPDHTETTTHFAQGHLRVAIGNRPAFEWLLTVVHEYVHFKQWMRDDPIFLHKDYAIMEAATEKELAQVVQEFKLPIPRRTVIRETKKYLKKLHAETAKY